MPATGPRRPVPQMSHPRYCRITMSELESSCKGGGGVTCFFPGTLRVAKRQAEGAANRRRAEELSITRMWPQWADAIDSLTGVSRSVIAA